MSTELEALQLTELMQDKLAEKLLPEELANAEAMILQENSNARLIFDLGRAYERRHPHAESQAATPPDKL